MQIIWLQHAKTHPVCQTASTSYYMKWCHLIYYYIRWMLHVSCTMFTHKKSISYKRIEYVQYYLHSKFSYGWACMCTPHWLCYNRKVWNGIKKRVSFMNERIVNTLECFVSESTWTKEKIRVLKKFRFALKKIR